AWLLGQRGSHRRGRGFARGSYRRRYATKLLLRHALLRLFVSHCAERKLRLRLRRRDGLRLLLPEQLLRAELLLPLHTSQLRCWRHAAWRSIRSFDWRGHSRRRQRCGHWGDGGIGFGRRDRSLGAEK